MSLHQKSEKFLEKIVHTSESQSVRPVKLIVPGQGTITMQLTKHKPFDIIIADSFVHAQHAIRLNVREGAATFYELKAAPAGTAFPEIEIEDINEGNWHQVSAANQLNSGLDEDADCVYWYSLDYHSRMIRFGKGEMRLNATDATFSWKSTDAKNLDEKYNWLAGVSLIDITQRHVKLAETWLDAVSTEPAMGVLPMDEITLEDIAENRATVAANLTHECQMMYYNVAGKKFVLDAPDFPQFSAAIKQSIADPNGWCYKKLIEKSSEFGETNIRETYLRITLGIDQGESPGVPFVVEIWPTGHFSPVHNHAHANGIVKVLHGAITVHLFRSLSTMNNAPMATYRFVKDQITWISPHLNQMHQLENCETDDPCITMNCYRYSSDDQGHYGYFDYVTETGGKKNIGHFTPNSDMDYMIFKNLMKEEWVARNPSA